MEHTDQSPYLVCTENISKNNRGGLEQRKIDAKQVVHHSNTTNPDRCFVALFKNYVEHCPPPSQWKILAFYLTPIQIPRTSVWYTTTPVGHNALNQTVKPLYAKKPEQLDLKQITLSAKCHYQWPRSCNIKQATTQSWHQAWTSYTWHRRQKSTNGRCTSS